MKYGPYIFMGLLLALAISWLGMVATPQLQIGNAQPTNLPPANIIYPTPYPGLASVGQDVYRANGCAYCHSQAIRQDRPVIEVIITKPATNQVDVVQALAGRHGSVSQAEAEKLVEIAGSVVLTTTVKSEADAAQKALTDAGASASVHVVPTGPDVARGWGTRQTVGQDYVYAAPVMLGSSRLGPDLTNVGLRRPDAAWHLMHLYNPRLEVPGSMMPQYPFLFEKRARGARPAADALPITGDQEIVPTAEAKALVAYLVNLRADMPLFEAPAPPLPTAVPATGDTNQLSSTNAMTLTNAIIIKETATNPAAATAPATK